MAAEEHPQTAEQRRDALKQVYLQARSCARCPELVATRKNVVFGSGNANADLMFVGEAPGASEDEQGVPFVGQAGKLLEKLLGEVGLERGDVFIANTLKCLRYNAQVQLGDGSWERIGRLVRARYGGSVMSVGADGELEARTVVGWHESPIADRRVFRLTYASAKRAGAGRVCIELTDDHPVLTERGYVAVADLRSSDRVATGQGLTDVAYDVVCGTLLGDGSLQRKSASLAFAHSERQLDYALFKMELLRELGSSARELAVAAAAGSDRRYGVVHVRTLAHRALRTLGADFYDDTRKRVPPRLVDELNDRMLAVWFMDDGYTRIRPSRRPRAEIATLGFEDDELQTLLAGLKRLGLASKSLRGRIHFDVDATQALSERIAPFVPVPMRYKLHPEVEVRIPFDPERWVPRTKPVMYDRVEIEDVTMRERAADRSFFCIDVETNHNFVTAGGVVHNCRPPNNRDPLPAELQNCRDYLDRQVELVQPKLICTLGNFATKLLRQDPTGITRLHGQEELLTLGRRTVRLYPIFHPAAALYTPRMLATLREDFMRLPGLLEQPAPEQPEWEDVPEPEVEVEVEPESEAGPAAEQRSAAKGAAAKGESGEKRGSAGVGGEENDDWSNQLGLF